MDRYLINKSEGRGSRDYYKDKIKRFNKINF